MDGTRYVVRGMWDVDGGWADGDGCWRRTRGELEEGRPKFKFEFEFGVWEVSSLEPRPTYHTRTRCASGRKCGRVEIIGGEARFGDRWVMCCSTGYWFCSARRRCGGRLRGWHRRGLDWGLGIRPKAQGDRVDA